MPKPVKPEEIPKKVEEEESEEESSDSSDSDSSDSSDSSSDSSDDSSSESSDSSDSSDSSEDEKEKKKKKDKKDPAKSVVVQPTVANGKGKEDVKGKQKVEEAQKGIKHKRSDEESSRDTQPDKKKAKPEANGNGNAKVANGKANGHANGETNGEANGHANGHTDGTPSIAPSKMSEKEVNEWKTKHQLTVTKVSNGSDDPTAPFANFSDADFPEYIQKSVKTFGFSTPTPIQAQAWPLVMQGRDIVGIAETGSGKTLAFGYPAIMHIKNKKVIPGPKVLVLAPTRELAQQIHEVLHKACEPAKLSACCVFGGVDKRTQHDPVKKADVVIATPGRLIDLLEDGSAKLHNVEYIVFDEADRMLDMGFQPQIAKIVAGCPPKAKRQTLMFSATWPIDVQKFAQTYLRDPTQITIGSTNLAGAKKITQIVDVCSNQNDKKFKFKKLLKHLCASEDRPRILVFMLYKHTCDAMYEELYRDNFNVDILHGGKAQNVRNKAIENFKNGTTHILIATDVAARGLDIKDIKYVMNVEMPLVMEDYIHRIGRTGRAGETGSAYTFFCPDDKQHARQLVRILEESSQKVPVELSKIAETAPVTKPRKTAMEQLYGDFAKGADADFLKKKPTKITFD
jgi:superfamily II DNA/RNA helicase